MKKFLIAILFFLSVICGVSANTNYYIDYTNGLDTNNGTSKSTPWKHAPGMVNCSNNCASYTGAGGGDSWVLKGCVTWPATVLPWAPSYQSEIAAVNVGGLDQTWWDNTVAGCSTAWNRPIINAGGLAIWGASALLDFHNLGLNASYMELIGGSFSGAGNGLQWGNTSTGGGWDHMYVHNVTWSGNTVDSCMLFFLGGNSSIAFFTNNVVDLTDSVVGGYTACYALYGSFTTISNNIIKYVSNGMVVGGSSTGRTVHDNFITNIGPDLQYSAGGPGNYHGNCYEDNGATGTSYFYNNVCQHMVNTGTASGSTLGWWFAIGTTSTYYVWNNILWDTANGNAVDIALPLVTSFSGGCPSGSGSDGNGNCTPSGSFILLNNTVEAGPDSGPTAFIQIPSNATSTQFINDHFITSATNLFSNGSGTVPECNMGNANNCTQSNILQQSLSVANGQGFTSSEIYVFSPTNLSNSTVGTGTNLTSTGTGSLASLLNDTTYGCFEISSPYVTVSCPTRTSNARPSNGAWNIGAYQFTSVTAPSPPTSANLSNGGSVGAHTVTVTWNASITTGVGYFVYRGTASGQESGTPLNMSAVGTSCTGPSGGCTYTDSTVIAGQNLFYTIEAYNGTVFSSASNEISTTVPVSAPTGLVISH